MSALVPASVRVCDAAAWPVSGPVVIEVAAATETIERLLAVLPVEVARSRRHTDLLRLTATAGALRAALAVADPRLADHLDARLASWRQPPPDLQTPAGVLPTASRAVVMGICNVTPDSFSDGGVSYLPAEHPRPALAAAAALLEAGADVIDVGGESTRPGAEPVGVEEELHRVLPVVTELAASGAVVSIDTTKAAVARAALEAGAALVNDVSAGALDPVLLDTVAAAEVPYVLMHMQGTPPTMQQDPRYLDVVAEVHQALDAALDLLTERGIDRERVVLDPGIGFGKRLEHNLALLRELSTFTAFGRPVLVGASRKGFLGTLTGGAGPTDRLEGSLAVAALAVAAGARILRVHDVAETVRAVRVAEAVCRSPEPPS
ncbi:MAG: dihydropteroate synthase [Nitriliruptoraceae bacterium]